MIYRRLGSSGLKVSALSLGSWVTFGSQIDEDTAYRCMIAAREAGVNFFDNAEGYAEGKSELVMGRAIKKAGWKQKDIVVSTKIFWGGSGPNDKGLSRKHLIEGTKAAIGRLGLEYVDLVYCHRPDIETPIEETVRAMSFLVNQGYAMYWGTSEWSAEEIRAAHAVARTEHLVPPTMEQPHYNMLDRDRVEKEYAPLYRDVGLGLTIYSPLASGLISGKYAKGAAGAPEGRYNFKGYEWLKKSLESDEGKQKVQTVEKLRPIAGELGCTLAQLGLAWCLLNPHVSSVITGASRPEQVVENMKAIEVYGRLTPAVVERIESILGNRPEPQGNYR